MGVGDGGAPDQPCVFGRAASAWCLGSWACTAPRPCGSQATTWPTTRTRTSRTASAPPRARCGVRARESAFGRASPPPPSLSPFPLYISPPSPPPSLPISLLTRRRLSCPAAGGRGAGGAAQGGVGVGRGAGPGGGLRLGEARHQVARDEKRRERDRPGTWPK